MFHFFFMGLDVFPSACDWLVGFYPHTLGMFLVISKGSMTRLILQSIMTVIDIVTGSHH